MDIPPYLLEQVRSGKVGLFLGAGASVGAMSPIPPKSPPIGAGLAKLLSERFLGGEANDRPLTSVAEYCIAKTDLITVQHYIAEVFERFQPSAAQLLLPSFRWAALVTTNYDRIIERAYELAPNPLQIPVPFLRGTDRVDQMMRDPNRVPLLKIHGCISLKDDDRYPFILTIDQYVTHREGRGKLFSRFFDYAGEYTFVFVGYRLEDPDVRQILHELTAAGMSRPRHYVVTPHASTLDKMIWESKRIETLDGTFEEFLRKLDEGIPHAFRTRISLAQHPIAAKFSSHGTLSQGALSFVSNDVAYLYPGMQVEAADAHAFYKGSSYGWGGIVAGLDARRTVADTVLSDAVLLDEAERPRVSDFYLIKGYAGSGKTVLIKRLAFDTAVEFSRVALFLRADARLSVEPVEELARLLDERIFIFVDGLARRAGEIDHFIKQIRQRHLKVTLIATERTNEWNVDCEELSSLIDDEFELRSLSSREVDSILVKLEKNNALGVLAGKSMDERQRAFLEYADRQLLVAMYEITSGKPFQDIVYDEYRNIVNEQARRIYLTICSLNRLGVPVRAGLVNRICGVSFADFKERFFLPLQSIVITEEYKAAMDMAYRARHPWIAEVVFERAVGTEADRFDLYIAMLKALDVGYTADRTAFREMIRSRNLLDMFSSPKLVFELFDVALANNDRDAYVLQQRAIYEMKRANGNLARAFDLLSKARELLPNDKSILHSMSELELARARVAESSVEKSKHREQAGRYAAMLTGSSADSGHGHSTLVKIALEKFQETLKSNAVSDEDLAAGAKAVETALNAGLQRFRSDEYLLTMEAEFASLLRNDAKAIKSLEKAFSINPASVFVSKSLGRVYEIAGDVGKAREVLLAAKRLVPGDKSLNASLARLLDRYYPEESLESELCWRRSFTTGDANFAYQFSYGRRLYLNGKKQEAAAIFKDLRLARVSREVKAALAGWVYEGKQIKKHRGNVIRREDNYAWVALAGEVRGIFLGRNHVPEGRWGDLQVGDSIEFALAFNYLGPAASITRLDSP